MLTNLVENFDSRTNNKDLKPIKNLALDLASHESCYVTNMEKIGEHNENEIFTLRFDLGKTYMLHGILLLQNM